MKILKKSKIFGRFGLPVGTAKSKLALCALTICAFTGSAHADFNPVALTQGSYTYDIVVEASAPQPLPYCIDVTAGDGVGLGDNTYYEQGLYAPPGQQGANSGVPVHNTTFTNINNSNVVFQMPPDYTVNNEVMVDSAFTSGTLMFNSPTTATNLAILCCGGGGALTVNYIVTHSDGSTENGTLSLPDWFGGGPDVAWGANGRITSGGGYNNFNGSSVNNNAPYLYDESITVSGNSPVTSIQLSSPSGNHGNFFAVSGNGGGDSWTPISLASSSFNVMGIVPAAIPYPVTATMDNGTNFVSNSGMNTWFEQGFVRNTEGGLPPSGSVFSSLSQPSHFYQMGDYSTNNAILIDPNHLIENITPVAPASYYALSFLTAGANISGQMTNICIIQHADGVNETNFFLAYDWFDSSHPGAIAVDGNGRVSMQNRTVNEVGNTVPYLFESYFNLQDITSPVTNVVVEYFEAPSTASTAYVMAISGSTTGIGPLITAGPSPVDQNWLVGQTATFTVSVTGTAPLTNSWLVLSNGVYVPLSDGVDPNGSIVSGSSTTTLTISNLTVADTSTYEYVASNPYGSQQGTATLEVLAPGSSLEWSGTDNSGVWDVNNSANWINLADDSQIVFTNADQVTFDDTTGAPTTVTVNGTISPSVFTVNTSVNSFSINGPGTLSGSGSFIKTGSSRVNLNLPSTFVGSANIEGGTVGAGYFVFANASSVTITNASTMDFVGSTMNNHTPITVSGFGDGGIGAIYNSANFDPLEVLNITLAGDTLFGGSARWDLGAGSQISGPHYLTIDWSGGAGYGEWTSLTIGATVAGISLTNASTIGMKYMDSAFQNPSTLFTIATNCTMNFYNGGYNGSLHLLSGSQVIHQTAPSGFYGNNIIFENNSSFISYGNTGDTTPVNSAITLNGVAHMVIGDHYMVYTNLISGPGGFVEDYYNNDMVFSASNTYTGPTVIGSSGNTPEVALTGNGSISQSSLIFFGGNDPTVPHIDVSGRTDETLTLANGQTLAGVGGINGSLIVSSGATISPGGTNTTIGITTGSNPVGTLAASDNATLNGTTVIKLDGSTNDMIEAAAGLTYGGTLNVVNIGSSPLAAGNSFKVFNAATYTGSFSGIIPTTPGSGLIWDLSHLNSAGVINVIGSGAAGPKIGGINLVGGNLVLSGNGGTPNATYYVLTTTNLTIPVSQWVPIATNAFDSSGDFDITNTITGGSAQMFYMIKQP